jgi:hypothetical protein
MRRVVLDAAEVGVFIAGRRGRTRVWEIVTLVKDWGVLVWGRSAVGRLKTSLPRAVMLVRFPEKGLRRAQCGCDYFVCGSL